MAEFPTYEQMAKNVAEKALDEILYQGKSIREWAKIITEQEPCEDAISRQATVEFLEKHAETYEDVRVKMGFKASASLINNRNNLPPVTPQQKTGRWIEHFDESGKWYECDQCHTDWGGSVNYCPNCGCCMFEPQESEDNE